MIIPEITYSVLKNKCPRCHKGKIFVSNNPYDPWKFSKMHDSCSECHLHYEKEPGFFYGALYVSYALMAGIFIIWFVADLLWLHMDAFVLALSVVGSMLILFPIVYRWARIIWLNFFVRYEKPLHEKMILTKKTIHENNT